MLESGLVLYDNKYVTSSLGTPGSVEFDFLKIWNFKKRCENFDPSLLRFYHIHPEGMLWYSQTDLNCIKGLNLAFKTEVYFSIITFNDGNFDNFYSSQISFRLINGEMDTVKDIPLNFDESIFLKYLSYGEVFVD